MEMTENYDYVQCRTVFQLTNLQSTDEDDSALEYRTDQRSETVYKLTTVETIQQ